MTSLWVGSLVPNNVHIIMVIIIWIGSVLCIMLPCKSKRQYMLSQKAVSNKQILPFCFAEQYDRTEISVYGRLVENDGIFFLAEQDWKTRDSTFHYILLHWCEGWSPWCLIPLQGSDFPVNTKYLYTIDTTLDQRRGRWANVV